jgi:hypothetical protein
MRPDTRVIRESVRVQRRKNWGLRSPDVAELLAFIDQVESLCSRNEALERALRATLESHDIGHSPCDCIEVRAVVEAP